MALFAGAAYMRCASVFFASNYLWGGEGALAPRPKENSKQKDRRAPRPTATEAPCAWPNQVATGAGKAFAYGTGAGGSLRMANQEAMGADEAFAYSTGTGGRSHLGAGARLSRTTRA